MPASAAHPQVTPSSAIACHGDSETLHVAPAVVAVMAYASFSTVQAVDGCAFRPTSLSALWPDAGTYPAVAGDKFEMSGAGSATSEGDPSANSRSDEPIHDSPGDVVKALSLKFMFVSLNFPVNRCVAASKVSTPP